MDDAPLHLELDSDAYSTVVRAFLSWADSEKHVRVIFTPDVLLAIDTKSRRGFLLDEIYFITVWISRGGSAFRRRLEREALAGSAQLHEQDPATAEPDPERLLLLAIEKGAPFSQVKDLI